MSLRIDLETSSISTCVTDRSDAASAYRRDSSRQWWSKHAMRYERFTSAEVVAEPAHPHFRWREAAAELTPGLRLLPITEDAERLVRPPGDQAATR